MFCWTLFQDAGEYWKNECCPKKKGKQERSDVFENFDIALLKDSRYEEEKKKKEIFDANLRRFGFKEVSPDKWKIEINDKSFPKVKNQGPPDYYTFGKLYNYARNTVRSL